MAYGLTQRKLKRTADERIFRTASKALSIAERLRRFRITCPRPLAAYEAV